MMGQFRPFRKGRPPVGDEFESEFVQMNREALARAATQGEFILESEGLVVHRSYPQAED